MARPGLTRHRKFLVLARRLGSDALALGHLEFLWETANESGDPVFPDAESLEAAARWGGEPGALAAALASVGLVDAPDGGWYCVHDYWHHCPDYVRKRERREEERRNRVTDRSQSSQRPVTVPPAAEADRSLTEKRLHSPLPTPSTEKKRSSPPKVLAHRPLKSGGDPDFEAFYAAYPRHTGRADAEKAWRQTAVSRPPLPVVLAALKLINASEPQFIPYPASWLRAERWTDEAPKNGGAPQPQRTAYNDRAGELCMEADAVEASDPELAGILREEASWRSGIKPVAPRTED